MAMAAPFFNHIGHLGLGCVSLSGVLHSVYQQNSDNVNRNKIASGYVSIIGEYINNARTNGTMLLVKTQKALHSNSVIDKIPQLFQMLHEEETENGNQQLNEALLMPEVLKTLATVRGTCYLDSEQEFASKQMTSELRALIKEHGIKLNEMMMVVDNDESDETELQLETKKITKDKSSKNLRNSIQHPERPKFNIQQAVPSSSLLLLHRSEYEDLKSLKAAKECHTLVSECKAAAAAATAATSAVSVIMQQQ